ncbi:2-hydroxyhepta-2,4-diene-1,7-dioate isomerase [Duganella sp. FT134W]|uniref:2-hydroxyhepta-2,4-diene-1,7-dioate isomerase n=1 Tax=Duganella margarita TaxID=2692170 RepID=A0A7X4H5R4_9BURK|nr:fumarylacetoacetate hydrolase family protein [Duganella margarita]MYM74804.1 2-hydroxyhepta-2,4-diene-1,7-dioate isomerase [Duganella margarita]
MRLVRYGRPGKEKPGLIDDEGKLRDLSGVIGDVDAAALAPKALRKLEKIAQASLPLVRGTPRFGVPLARVGKFICIGLNYSDHAAEAGMPIPKHPIIFLKANTALSGPDDAIMMPPGSKKMDWEVELGIVIGTRAQAVSEADALRYVAGYTVVHDVSEREYQLERGGQWSSGKSFDTFGPVGPWLVTPEDIYDVQDLDLYLDVNGKRMQTGNTSTMIFSAAQIVSYVSTLMTLEPGDVIATGTPPGVGMGRKPQRFLKKGDVVRLGIAGLGEQQQEVIAWKATK